MLGFAIKLKYEKLQKHILLDYFQAVETDKNGAILVFLTVESLMYFMAEVCALIRESLRDERRAIMEELKPIVGITVLEENIRYNYIKNCSEPWR